MDMGRAARLLAFRVREIPTVTGRRLTNLILPFLFLCEAVDTLSRGLNP
jgi:hypothetical protein